MIKTKWSDLISRLTERGSALGPLLNRIFDRWRASPYLYTVIVPVIIYASYTLLWAAPRYESHGTLTVQSPSGLQVADPAMMLLAGMGGSSSGSDAELVKAFIASADMLGYLDTEIQLSDHYQQSGDVFSRLSPFAEFEDKLEYYRTHIALEIDEKSQIISIRAQGFDPVYAQTVTAAIISRAEWYINSIGHALAEEQLSFIRGESQLVEARLADARLKVLEFQRENGLLDPEAEGMAQQQITYSLEGQISTKKTELRVLSAIMSEEAPQVRALRNELEALETQLAEERGQLSTPDEENVAVSDIMANYTGLRLELELALQAYTAAQISMEQARMEAYKQLKYLVIVQSPTLPERYAYPQSLYNSILLLLLLSTVFGVCRILISVYRELK